MIKYSDIRKCLNIENMNGNAEDFAFLTHTLHNQKNINSNTYQERSEKYLDEISRYNTFNEDSAIYQQGFLPIQWDVSFPAPTNPEFTFIDLFAGIGGFRIPFQNLGGQCIFSSEYNVHAQKAYELNFGEVPFGDITKLNLELVPKHDVLCGGFPCQPFSISGKMKGFEDTRGTLIYYVLK